MFVYYAKWIPQFSDRIQPLMSVKIFPLGTVPLTAYNLLKLEEATHHSIDESSLFVVECDVSEVFSLQR